MSDWTSGYVADVGYTFGYYTELNPLRIKLAFMNVGLRHPDIGTACELGFGQGVSTNLHAAASVVSWSGTDFNPSQAGFAQELAAASGAKASLFDQSFEEFCTRDDLPEFDYIGLHGIWSWISDENRAVLTDFIRRKLKVGGVLYVSYNTQPGWAGMIPMRDLLVEHSESMAASGAGIVPKIDAALSFAEKLIATNPIYCQANPQIPERLKKIKEQKRNYLAHEYFNRDWHPMSFSRMAEWLSQAKLQYACSAHYIDHIDTLNLSADQQALLKEIPNAMFRETVRDFCMNQQFRRDYWVRGARRLNPLEQAETLRELRVVLVQPKPDSVLKVTGALGEASLQEHVYGPILEALGDYQPKTISQLEAITIGRGISFPSLIQTIMILSGISVLAAAQDENAISRSKETSQRINQHLLKKARGSDEVGFLASPVTGGGIPVARMEQLFLLARSEGKRASETWAEYVWPILSSLGQRVMKNGVPVEAENDARAEISSQAKEFAATKLPMLIALGVVTAAV